MENKKIPHDAPLTEVWATGTSGKRLRVYRGDTRAHIEWKVKEYTGRGAVVEVVEIPREGASVG